MKDRQKDLLQIIGISLLAVLISYGTGHFFGYRSFSFAWVLNFVLMAWYSMISEKLDLKLDSSHFEEKTFEKGGRIYKLLGIEFFKKLLVLVGWEKITRKNNPIKKDRDALEALEFRSRLSEAGHTLIAVLVLLVGLYFSGSLAEAKWFFITNLLLNVYPVLLQRYNRLRYTKILRRFAQTRRGSGSSLWN